jgi:arginyl-tRNA synthetase
MQTEIIKLLESVLQGAGIEVYPAADQKFGDYTSNVAFAMAKKDKKKPMIIAQELVDLINENDTTGFFERVTATKPGFLNFKLSLKTYESELQTILNDNRNYGKPEIGRGEKVQIEYISANPTGPLTLANGRGGFLGDALSNVLEFVGYDVEREYYVNDMGNQILTLGKSMLAAVNLAPDYEETYKGDYIEEWAKEHKSKLEQLVDVPYKAGQYAAQGFLKQIQETVTKKSGITIDRWTSEESIHNNKFVEKVLPLFEKKKLVYKKDGATWLKTRAFGDDKDRVIVTSDGYPTYFLGDAGHYLETQERGFTKKINILGPDHYGYVARIQAVAEILELDSEIIVTQAIRLIRDGKEVKMSKRKGNFVTFEELVTEAGKDAARFFFLMHNPESHMDFNLTLAKEKSNKNPVYYTQYAYVRAKSIIQKSSGVSINSIDTSQLIGDSERALMRELLQFSDVVTEIARDYRVSRLARYSLNLARSFHMFYEQEKVLSDDREVMQARLALLTATIIIFDLVFDLMGISKPDTM